METYARSEADYFPRLPQPNDNGLQVQEDRHLTSVPSATSIVLASRGITANAYARIGSLAVYSYVQLAPDGTTGSDSVASTIVRWGDTLTFSNPTLAGQIGKAYFKLNCNGNFFVTGDGNYENTVGGNYKINSVVSGQYSEYISTGNPPSYSGSDFAPGPINGVIQFTFGQPVVLEIELDAIGSG